MITYGENSNTVLRQSLGLLPPTTLFWAQLGNGIFLVPEGILLCPRKYQLRFKVWMTFGRVPQCCLHLIRHLPWWMCVGEGPLMGDTWFLSHSQDLKCAVKDEKCPRGTLYEPSTEAGMLQGPGNKVHLRIRRRGDNEESFLSFEDTLWIGQGCVIPSLERSKVFTVACAVAQAPREAHEGYSWAHRGGGELRRICT